MYISVLIRVDEIEVEINLGIVFIQSGPKAGSWIHVCIPSGVKKTKRGYKNVSGYISVSSRV